MGVSLSPSALLGRLGMSVETALGTLTKSGSGKSGRL